MSKKIFINAFIFVFSTYIYFLLFNVFFVVKGPIFKRNKVLSYREKLNSIEEDFKPFYFPNEIFEKGQPYIPVGSLPYSNTFYCDEGYGLIKFKTDRFGLRNNDSKWSNILNKENIFVIGDTFVQGQCVEDKYTISSKIQKDSDINTLNIGLSGNDPYDYYANLKIFLKPITEKLKKKSFVSLTFYDNDFIQRDFDKEEELKKNIENVIEIKNNSFTLKTDYKNHLSDIIQKKKDPKLCECGVSKA